MNGPDELAAALAERFRGVEGSKLRRNPAFTKAADAALQLLGLAAVVKEVAGYGELNAVGSPYRVVVARLRWVPEDHSERQRVAASQAEKHRLRPLVQANERGQVLGLQVRRRLIGEEAALATVRTEFFDPELRAAALAGLRAARP